jgi:hypothetical protein
MIRNVVAIINDIIPVVRYAIARKSFFDPKKFD